MEKKTISLRRRQLLQAAAVAGSLPFLATAARNAAAQATTNAPDTIGSGPVRVAVLDDFMRLAMDAADWKALGNRATIDFYHEPFRDQAVLARQMAPYEAIVIARHGQAFTADTISKLPKLKFLSNQGGTTYRLDMPQLEKQKVVISGGGRSRRTGSRRRGNRLCATHRSRAPSVLAQCRHARGPDLAVQALAPAGRQDAGSCWLGPHRRQDGPVRQGLQHEDGGMESQPDGRAGPAGG